MIQKTVLTTVGLLLAYSLFIYVFHSSIQRTAQTIEQRNIVKAEEFLYEDGQRADTIIIGSSMSNRLILDRLGKNYYNLSLEGMASVDGLRLIAKAKHRIRLLLIESNTLDRTVDTSFFEKIDDKRFARLREYIPFIRLKYQPAGVFKALVRDRYSDPMQELDPPIDTALISKIIRERLGHQVDVVNEDQLRMTINTAKKYIQRLRQQGTEIVFFEMPTDSRVRNIKVYTRLRELVKEAFPLDEYHFIPFPSEPYQTTDGVHLPKYECIRYSHYLAEQLKQNRSTTNLTQASLSPTTSN